jgi:2-aminoadipate transaminase
MFSERIERLSGSLIREILAVTQRPEVISFAGGLPAASSFPSNNLQDMPSDLLQYGCSEGEPRLRQLIAEYAASQGLPCSAEQVLVLSGSQQALDLVAKLMIDPGTPVVTEAPTYLAALQVFQLFGANITGVPQTAGTLDPRQLGRALADSGAGMAYLIPSYQNPSAACYSHEQRQELAKVLDGADVIVVEDDPYRELALDGPTPAPLVASLKSARWIYSGSFSKTLAPGLRLGYLIASPELFTPLLQLKQAVDLHSNRPGQWQIARWLEDAGFHSRLEALRADYRARRDAMQQALSRHFGALAEWQLPQGGLFFWLKLRQVCDTREKLQQAIDQQVLFMPGEAFYPDPQQGLGHVRLNFSHTPLERMEEGIKRLAAVFN